MSIDKKAVIEGAKDIARVAFFAALTAVVGYFTTLVSSLEPGSAYYIVGTLLLKFADKYVHKSDLNANGVAPF